MEIRSGESKKNGHVLCRQQNDLELSELISVIVKVLFPVPLFWRLFTVLYETVNGWKNPGSMNLDQDTVLLSICPAIVFPFCIPNFWMHSLLDRGPASKGCWMALFLPVSPNAGVMTLCWRVGSISLNPLSLMSGFKESFPTLLCQVLVTVNVRILICWILGLILHSKVTC